MNKGIGKDYNNETNYVNKNHIPVQCYVWIEMRWWELIAFHSLLISSKAQNGLHSSWIAPTTEEDVFWLLEAINVFIGSSHPLVCYSLLWFHMFDLDIAPSWWIGFLREIMYFLTKLVVWSHRTFRKQGEEFLRGFLPIFCIILVKICPMEALRLYSSTHPCYRIWCPLVVAWKPQPPLSPVKGVHEAWRASGTEWIWECGTVILHCNSLTF